MTLFTCFCVLAMIARTLAEDGVACCPPGNFMSFKKVPGKLVCFTKQSNETSPASLECEHGFGKFYYNQFIFKNGKADLNVSGTTIEDIKRYCVNDVSLTNNGTMKLGIVCYDEKVIINAYVSIVSVVFLTLTVIIYCALREIRDLFTKSFINLCSSLAIGLCLLAIIELMSTTNDGPETNIPCAARGYFTYFFLVTSFFWTTAISTQLLLSVRSPSSMQDHGWKSFAWYALFSWGCPAIITICMVIVDSTPGDHAKPGMGFKACWFNPMEPHLWYWLYSVLAVVLSVNILIFIYISQFFCRNNFASSQVSTLKYRFGLVLKLFVVMGLFWIIELFVVLVSTTNNVFWKILNAVIGLQGLWIFLAWVVFRKRVIKAMHDRGWLCCISNLVEKRLANCDEADDQIVQHTAVTMSER